MSKPDPQRIDSQTQLQDYISGAPPLPLNPNFPGQVPSDNTVSDFSLPSDHATFTAVTDDYNSLPTFPERPHFHEHHLRMRPATQLVCFDGCADDPYHPASMPIYQTATFVQPQSDQFGAYDYTRSGNPTRTALETLVAGLEDAHSAFAFTSGMAALSTVARLMDSGSEIIACADLYGGMHRLLSQVCNRMGVVTKFVDTTDLETVKKAMTPNVRLLHVESPSNPMMRISDLRQLAQIVHANGALMSVDSTMPTPYLCKPLDLGADIVIHSATKFLSGHSDVMGGIVCVRDASLAKRIAFLQNAEGTALAPFDCWLLMRGIKTLALRVERSQENACKVAAFLSRHPAVKRLHYTGPIPDPTKTPLIDFSGTYPNAENIDKVNRKRKNVTNISSSHSDFALHMRQCRGGMSVMSFETGDIHFSRRVVDACRLFKITVSFGSCNSLVEMPCVLSHASIPADKRTLPSDLIRLSIGIEDIQDIVKDLDRAFKCAASPVSDVRSITLHADEIPSVEAIKKE